MLTLGGNRLTSLPDSLWDLAELRVLTVSLNQLTENSEGSIGRLRELHTLDLGHNALSSMPESLGGLPRLTHLDLRANRLGTLPDSLAGLITLEKLDLRWNKLTQLPAWIERLEQRGCAVLL